MREFVLYVTDAKLYLVYFSTDSNSQNYFHTDENSMHHIKPNGKRIKLCCSAV